MAPSSNAGTPIQLTNANSASAASEPAVPGAIGKSQRKPKLAMNTASLFHLLHHARTGEAIVERAMIAREQRGQK